MDLSIVPRLPGSFILKEMFPVCSVGGLKCSNSFLNNFLKFLSVLSLSLSRNFFSPIDIF